MKKCEYTLQLIDHKGNIVWSRSERKSKISLLFVDNIIDDKWFGEESLMKILIHLEKRPDYGVSVLRAGVRRGEDED
jgi:hypothetical protein